MHFRLLMILAALIYAGPTLAEDCNFNWMLASEDGSKPSKEQYAEKDRREKECTSRVADEKKQAQNAPTRLKKEFKVDAAKMTDKEATARLNEEVKKQADARKADEARRQEAHQNKQMQHADELMKKQSDMLKGMGVNMESASDESDAQADAAELQAIRKWSIAAWRQSARGRRAMRSFHV